MKKKLEREMYIRLSKIYTPLIFHTFLFEHKYSDLLTVFDVYSICFLPKAKRVLVHTPMV